MVKIIGCSPLSLVPVWLAILVKFQPLAGFLRHLFVAKTELNRHLLPLDCLLEVSALGMSGGEVAR